MKVTLNKKVGFKRSTKRYRKNSILCGMLHSGTAMWTFGMGWSFGPLGCKRERERAWPGL